MSRLNPGKLHVTYLKGAERTGPIPGAAETAARRYTLTHSDMTGDLFLTIGADYDHHAISGLYTRLMRDEVLAEWLAAPEAGELPVLHVYVHVSGGFALGTAGWRNETLLYHLPLVLETFRYGDRTLFEAHPALDGAAVRVHFRAAQARFHRVEDWGRMERYRF